MSRLVGNLKQGLLFVISAPAGTGKTTLAHMLCEEFDSVVESVSCTTRPARSGEIEGQHYHFLSKEKFDEMAREGKFLEHATVFGNQYGTARELVRKQQAAGKHVVLVIDTQGAMQLKDKVPAIFIFITPPSLTELKERLRKRRTESTDIIEKRLSWAQKEIAMAGQYDYHIVNDNLGIAYQVLRSIVIAEEHKSAAGTL